MGSCQLKNDIFLDNLNSTSLSNDIAYKYLQITEMPEELRLILLKWRHNENPIQANGSQACFFGSRPDFTKQHERRT